MEEVFIQIIPQSILPALHVGHFSFKKKGILERKNGSVCLKCSIPQISMFGSSYWRSMDALDFGELAEMSRACTGQDCFQLLCTSILEAVLCGMMSGVARHEYVFPFDQQQRDFHDLTPWL